MSVTKHCNSFLLLINVLIIVCHNISCSPNILLFIIDDLRPTLSCFGDRIAITPNIDQIASNGFLFTNAFAQQSLCAPSRTSLLTSRRPDSLHLYDSHSYWRTTVGDFTSLPQYFKQFGYFTQSVGKVFHPGIVSNHSDDYPLSWSAPAFHGSTEKYKFAPVCLSSDGSLNANVVCPVDVRTQPEQTLPDIESTEFAIEFIKRQNTSKGIPFFLAVGFHKPHIPLKCPNQYLDLYPLSAINLAKNRFMPKNFPEVAWNPWMDLKARHDVNQLNISFPFGLIPDYFQKYIIQSYYSCVTYMDDMIGQILNQINQKQLSEDTIVMLLGDHGWSLGEHNEWSKYSNFDTALRVPFIISVPKSGIKFKYKNPFNKYWAKKTNKKRNYKRINELVELVDVFPTLADLAGLPVPHICTQNSTEKICTEGLSVKRLMTEKSKGFNWSPNWKSFVFSQYPRPSLKPQINSDQPVLKDITVMGYSMKSSMLRYTEWIAFNSTTFVQNWSQVFDRELYFDEQQNYNWANDQILESFVKYLSEILRNGWRGQIPNLYH